MRADGTSAVNAGVRFALQTLKAQRVVRFKSNRGSHISATILHPNTKVLDFQGLFVFLGRITILQFLPVFSGRNSGFFFEQTAEIL